MVLAYPPQRMNTSLVTNSNFPPQGMNGVGIGPSSEPSALVQTTTLSALVQTGTLSALSQIAPP